MKLQSILATFLGFCLVLHAGVVFSMPVAESAGAVKVTSGDGKKGR